MERKLAAIFSADVKGYSRLMGEDEAATIHTLTTYREVMTALIQRHRGRVVDSPGDNLLAEFPSAVDAVQGAVAVQQELQTRNAGLLDNRKMEYRIGLNVGDVVIEGGRIYGDGVNIAARIESLAEGGGICISGTVYDQIENKITLNYEYLGEQAVKNIKKPVRVYRIPMPPEASPSVVNANELQGPGQLTTPSKPLIEKRQQQKSSYLGLQEKVGWLSRQTRLQLSGSLILLAAVAAIVSAVYLPKTLLVQNAAAVLSGTTSLPLQNQPPIVTVPDGSFSLSAGIHRSFETVPSHSQRAVSLLDKVGRLVGFYAESHALVVGVSNYTGGWPPLPGVKKDVKAIVPVLEKYGFHVVVVMDPTLTELEGAYRDFIGKYGLAPNNRLLFYYAGSGYTIKPTYALSNQEDWMGYLVAREAPWFTKDPEGFRRHALSMERFVSMAREIETKHALFLFDSCFAGAIAFSLGRPSLAKMDSEITQRTFEPVRQFIAAGTADQQVPDESLFRQFFIKALQGDPEADHNGDGYVTGSELGQFLQEKITALSGGAQTPQYGKMADPRLNRGEFVFTPSLSVPSPVITALPSEW